MTKFKGELTLVKQEPLGSSLACVAMLSRTPLEIVTKTADAHSYVEPNAEMRGNLLVDLSWEFGIHLENVTQTINLSNTIDNASGKNIYVLGVKSLTHFNENHYLVLDNRKKCHVLDPNKIVHYMPSY